MAHLRALGGFGLGTLECQASLIFPQTLRRESEYYKVLTINIKPYLSLKHHKGLIGQH